MSSKEFGINIHEEWKGMTQPVGLVVEPIVLDRLGIFQEEHKSCYRFTNAFRGII